MVKFLLGLYSLYFYWFPLCCCYFKS